MKNKCFILLASIFLIQETLSDNFSYNSFNNHGAVGLINMPSARFYNESVFGVTLYEGEPDQKITFTASPYDWLEASVFYMNLPDLIQCRGGQFGDRYCSGYKDKGFNVKIRLKDEGKPPALAVGINDMAGTGYYGSEYIVGSYGINNIDFHFGLGWGNLSGSKNTFNNPFGYLDDSFNNRPEMYTDNGGQFQPKRYFSGEKASPFFGLSYVFNNRSRFKLEYDSTLTPGKIGYQDRTQEYSLGLEFDVSRNFTLGISSERGNNTTIRFSYKNNPKVSKKTYQYKKGNIKDSDSKYLKLRKKSSK